MKLYLNKDLQRLWGVGEKAVTARLRKLRAENHTAFVEINARTWALRLEDDDEAKSLRPAPRGRRWPRPTTRAGRE